MTVKEVIEKLQNLPPDLPCTVYEGEEDQHLEVRRVELLKLCHGHQIKWIRHQQNLKKEAKAPVSVVLIDFSD